ncbi:methyltransferase [Nocardia miyunensis]|uniref:methyltransferase n=1 Tax=Nocardia miyunensis TaxID=282684 RepID=UPI000A6AA05D|nr:methyltransferase [Nocardia miyunensis]
MGIFSGRRSQGSLHYSTPTAGLREALTEEIAKDRESARFLTAEANGYVYACCLRVVAQLGVADLLADGPVHVGQLATRVSADEDALYRVLRLLATRGICWETDSRVFVLMERGASLRSDSRFSVREGVLAATTPAIYRAGGELLHAVTTGEPAVNHVFGEPLFDYFGSHPSDGAEFHTGMGRYSVIESEYFVRECRLPETCTVVDVGGGQGSLLLMMLQRHRGLHGVLFDLPQVIARHRMGELEDAGRWKAVGGSFFEAVPAGDVYMLQYVLHNWDDQRCVQILRNCRRGMSPGGRVIIHDMIVPPGNEPDQSKVLDIVMLSIVTGRERTQQEFEHLLHAAGLRIVTITPPALGALSTIEAEAL